MVRPYYGDQQYALLALTGLAVAAFLMLKLLPLLSALDTIYELWVTMVALLHVAVLVAAWRLDGQLIEFLAGIILGAVFGYLFVVLTVWCWPELYSSSSPFTAVNKEIRSCLEALAFAAVLGYAAGLLRSTLWN